MDNALAVVFLRDFCETKDLNPEELLLTLHENEFISVEDYHQMQHMLENTYE